MSVTPSKARLTGCYYRWKFHSIATERSSRVSLRSTQLFLTVSMGLENISTNDDLLDGSTKRRLTLAEVEPSNVFGGWLTDVGPHFRLIVYHAMPKVMTFWEWMCHPICSVSSIPSKARLIGFCNMRRRPFHCHREKQQGFTPLHSAVSHNGNEVRQQVFKRNLARWLYRTQADACRSRAIEWLWQLTHRGWSPLPTFRISCDAGSDDLLGRIYHPVCSVSSTPSKARLIGFGDKWELQSIATERSSRVSLRSTQLFLTVSMRLER